ncbi:MAG TPA: diguanylate cyclase [Pseudomonadales bacterium]|nr:diguanylate cyclase [Pseudomonadales bacterium]
MNDFFTFDMQQQLDYSYSWLLVVVSLFLAISGACLAVWQSLLLKDIKNTASQTYIRASGAIALAGGVWSMHFVGMLAFSLATPVSYNIPMTLLSIIPAVFAGFWAEKWLANPEQDSLMLLMHALILGSGIGLMHYIGMEAMVMHASLSYEPTMFTASILMAVILSALTLIMLRHMHRRVGLSQKHHILMGGVGLGMAISTMHYLGMAASRFSGMPEYAQPSPADDYLFLTTLVFLVTTLTIVISYSGSLISQVRHQMDEIAVQEKELSAILAHAMSPIVTTGANGQIQTYNEQFKRLLNENDALLKGKSLALFIPEITGRFNKHGPSQWEIECHTEVLEGVDSLLIKANRFSRGDESVWVISITDLSSFKDSQQRRTMNANYDPLTGVFNRFYFDIQIERELELAAIKQHPISLLMIEIDQFEHIMSSQGKDAGDKVLKHTANLVHNALRSTDTICRFGGQKFIVIQPETTPDEAFTCAEQLRESVLSNPPPLGDLTVVNSLSIGIYSALELQQETPQRMLKRADQALFIAITNGRNRCVTYAHGSESSANP